MKLTYKKYILNFKFDAGTSRGVYREKPTWIIEVEHEGLVGLGESGPLNGLSIENLNDIEPKLEFITKEFKQLKAPENTKEAFQLALDLGGYDFPSIRFALETALLDLLNGGKKVIFPNDFVKGNVKIPINGLIWMGSTDFMRKQADEKPPLGFKCLKMKIGALELAEELEMIRYIRNKYHDMVLRLDANGAFEPEVALRLLKEIENYDIHSIEQPIRPGQRDEMAKLCAQSPIPVALDEELIGINSLEEKNELLSTIKPQYIILKPSLLGGFSTCSEWIALAERLNIGWWITSMLESNIGLNAIAQFTAEVKAKSFQGLGTGELYSNNFESNLKIDKGFLINSK